MLSPLGQNKVQGSVSDILTMSRQLLDVRMGVFCYSSRKFCMRNCARWSEGIHRRVQWNSMTKAYCALRHMKQGVSDGLLHSTLTADVRARCGHCAFSPGKEHFPWRGCSCCPSLLHYSNLRYWRALSILQKFINDFK